MFAVVQWALKGMSQLDLMTGRAARTGLVFPDERFLPQPVNLTRLSFSAANQEGITPWRELNWSRSLRNKTRQSRIRRIKH